MSLVKYSGFQTHAIPSLGTNAKIQVDRVQTIDPTSTLNREKNKEVGRSDTIDWSKKTPTVAYRLTQNESQDLKFFETLANVADSVDMNQDSFNSSAVDMLSYLTADDASILGTVWYPKLRLAGFSFNISDPDAKIERSFDLVGEAAHAWQGANKYVVQKLETADSGEMSGTDWEYTVATPSAVEDPANSGVFILRVSRIRSGTTTDLSTGSGTNQWEYSAPTLTVHNAVVGDSHRLYWSSGSYLSGDIWTDEDTAPGATLAYNTKLIIGSTELEKIQSCAIDVRFEREDWKQVGSKEVKQRGVKDKTVTISLPRLLENYTLDELLLGQSADFGHIDIEDFLDNLTFRLKVYTTDAKSAFAWGMKVTNCTPTEVKTPVGIDSYTNRDFSLEAETFILSDDETVIDA